MSLTSLLRAPDVRAAFQAQFKKPKVALQAQLLAPATDPTRAHAALMGMAFDCLLRLHISLVNQDSGNVWRRPWVAEEAVEQLELAVLMRMPVFAPDSSRSTRGLVSKARRALGDASAEYDGCLEKGVISERMMLFCIMLAQLEQFYRCGTLSSNFGEATPAGCADLKNLLAVARSADPMIFKASRVCVLNPNFRMASALVGGADADVLIDDTLWEIKTTKALSFTAEMYRQLIGYYLLYRIAGGVTMGPRPKPEIRHLGVYFSRYGVIHRFPISAVIDEQALPTFMAWFKRRARGATPMRTAA